MRKRRVFGPLFYSTVVVAGITLLYVGVIRMAEWREREVTVHTEIDAETAVRTAVAALGSNDWRRRVMGALSPSRPCCKGRVAAPRGRRFVAGLGAKVVAAALVHRA